MTRFHYFEIFSNVYHWTFTFVFWMDILAGAYLFYYLQFASYSQWRYVGGEGVLCWLRGQREKPLSQQQCPESWEAPAGVFPGLRQQQQCCGPGVPVRKVPEGGQGQGEPLLPVGPHGGAGVEPQHDHRYAPVLYTAMYSYAQTSNTCYTTSNQLPQMLTRCSKYGCIRYMIFQSRLL